jgi:hypothetical protein
VTFGKAYTWEDGVSATVSVPKKYTPTDSAAGTEGFKHYVSFTITIVNKSGKPFDPTMVTHSVQSNDLEGSEVFDSAQLPEQPQTKVLNGRQVKYKVAYAVANPKDIIFELAPGFEYNSAIWTKS